LKDEAMAAPSNNPVVSLTTVVNPYKVGRCERDGGEASRSALRVNASRFIVGTSGSGKTTLLNLIGCIDPPGPRLAYGGLP
jgi:ABC-type lipoprotein export system ATPase subunit